MIPKELFEKALSWTEEDFAKLHVFDELCVQATRNLVKLSPQNLFISLQSNCLN